MTILIKPSSSMCNLRCKYCFYFDVAKNREVQNFGFMNDETASVIIDKALEFVDGGKLNLNMYCDGRKKFFEFLIETI